MKKRQIKWFIVILGILLFFGGMAPMQVAAEEMEVTDAIEPDEIELITEEEALEINKAFKEHKEIESYAEVTVNSGFSSSYGYDSLETNEQKECYAMLKEKAFVFHEEFLEPVVRNANTDNEYYIWEAFDFGRYNFSLVTFRKILFAVEADFPELFWYTGNFSYTKNSEGYVKYVYPKIEKDYIQVSARKEAKESIDSGMVEYLEAIDKAKEEGIADMELELLIHDMIVMAVDYAYVSGTKTPSDEGHAHSIVGVFDKSGVVCEGYAKTFQLLCNYAELPSIYAVGYGNGGGHAWNLVCLEGQWYNLDVTWNDIGTGKFYDGIRYSFYNCTSDDFGNHVYMPSVFPGMYDVPETKATKYNYYEYYDLTATGEDVENEEAFTTFFENAVKRSQEKGDYLLHFSCENTAVGNEFRTLLSEKGKSLLESMSDGQIWYQNTGECYYSGSSPYVIYYPITCVYADSYQVIYGKNDNQLQFHLIERRTEIPEDGNYQIVYSNNDDVGTAQAQFIGIGLYENLGSYVFEYQVLPEPTSTPTPTPSPTVTPKPTNTPIPTVTPRPSGIPTEIPQLEVPNQVVLKAQTKAANSIKLSWKKALNAKGYVVYRATSKNGTYKICKKITSGNKTTYEDKNLKKQTTYYYYVKAYNEKGQETVYGTPSKIVSKKVIGPLSAPKNVKMKKGSYNSKENTITLSFSKVKGADKIVIYGQKVERKKNSLGNYVYATVSGSKKKKITTVSGKKTSAKVLCENYDVETEFCKYTIKAYYKTDTGKKITSKESKAVVVGAIGE